MRTAIKTTPVGQTTHIRSIGKRITLDSWINEALTDPDKAGPCTMISLVHMQGPNGQREIHTAPITEGKTPKILAALFEGKAQGYAQDLAGIQTFNLLAFYGSSEPQAYHPFSISGEAFHPGLATESPDSTGITQMLMRHVEIKEKLHVQERVTIFDALLQTVEFLNRQCSKLSEDNAEAFAIMKEIMLEKTLNQHDLRMKELAFERSTNLQDKLMKIAPAMVNSVAGREVFPQGTADTAILESVAEHITPDMLNMLVSTGTFPPEVAGLLTDRFTQITEAKVKNAERVKQLAAQSRVVGADPEADAAGETTE